MLPDQLLNNGDRLINDYKFDKTLCWLAHLLILKRRRRRDLMKWTSKPAAKA